MGPKTFFFEIMLNVESLRALRASNRALFRVLNMLSRNSDTEIYHRAKIAASLGEPRHDLPWLVDCLNDMRTERCVYDRLSPRQIRAWKAKKA